jgi:hypothetical protein
MMRSVDPKLELAVISSIADDYEQWTTLLREVDEWLAADGSPVVESDVQDALSNALTKGYASAYSFNAETGNFEVARSPVIGVAHLWFLATEAGKALVSNRPLA